MSNFQKLGNDRATQNIQRAFGNAPTGLVTGDITRGDIVSVEFSNASESNAVVKPRRSGAIPISCSLGTPTYFNWSLSGSRLTVDIQGTRTGSMTFWVF